MNEKPPLGAREGLTALLRCVARTVVLLARRRVHQPGRRLGQELAFADGTTTAVYRETVVARPPPEEPCLLVVSFRLRGVKGERLHALFRAESLLNTMLFVGFFGFVSKLWCRHDQRGLYRGVYEWDGPARAEAYVRALWWALIVVSARDSIHYAVVPGVRRDDVLDDAEALAAAGGAGEWWRLTAVAPARA